jgi:hypothetical protein
MATHILNPGRSEHTGNMAVYDVYSGRINHNPIWLESVHGLGNAYELMTRLATKSPGPYFIARANTKFVQGTIDTSLYYNEARGNA